MLKLLWKSPWWLKAATLLIAAALAWQWWGRGPAASTSTTFVARRGPLEINVLEGGGAEALESQDIKCEVRGYQGVKILKIVEEGYLVTDEDVRTNKVLVELDSSELKKQLTQQEIQLESTVASLTEARQAYDIQLNQNLSDIKSAEQKARFARLDFEKFLGSKAAVDVIAELRLGEEEDAYARSVGAPTSTPGTNSPPPRAAKGPAIDFTKYAHTDVLDDGEAKQKLRKFEDEYQVAKKSLTQTLTKLDGTRRLHEKGFLSKLDLDTDEYILENDKLKLQTAETARDLFLKYEFIKTAEETLSKYVEALMELGRTRKSAVSKLAQAEAKMKGAEARFDLEKKQRDDFADQIAKCAIPAKKPGLVVYGGNSSGRYYYGEEQIREGALVREQQPIITIPNLSKMAVKVRIHETYIKKVKKGQQARITADAFPDRVLLGEITKVGVLPDSQNRWMNPDNKVYLCTVTISEVTDWLKPGMSTKVEILVNKLADAIYVPIQAVTPIDGKHFCFLPNGTGQEKREVEIGEFNDEFIEIRKGIAAGDRVALRTPDGIEADTKSRPAKPAAPEPPAPQAASVGPGKS